MTAERTSVRRSRLSPFWFALLAGVLAATPLPAQTVSRDDADRRSAATRGLIEAARAGDLAAMVSFIDVGADVNGGGAADDSPLTAAARSGRLPAVRLLLDWGADPNLGTARRSTALNAAAGEGHTPVVNLLLDHGASIDQAPAGEGTALIAASAAGRVETVRQLVARGADVNLRTRATIVTQDEQVVYDNEGRGRVLPVRRLHVQERSALTEARRGGHDAVAAFLVSVGARE